MFYSNHLDQDLSHQIIHFLLLIPNIFDFFVYCLDLFICGYESFSKPDVIHIDDLLDSINKSRPMFSSRSLVILAAAGFDKDDILDSLQLLRQLTYYLEVV